MQETGPTIYRPFSRSFERLSICGFTEKAAHFTTLSVGLVWGLSLDPPVGQSRLSDDAIKSRDLWYWNLAPYVHFLNDLGKLLKCQSHSSLTEQRTMKPVSFIEQERKDQGDSRAVFIRRRTHVIILTSDCRMIKSQAFFFCSNFCFSLDTKFKLY